MPVLRPGQRLGPYVVEGLLGLGGMAEVYAATHTSLDRKVAIKVLNPIFNTDPTFPLRFLREARAVARLRHPNIITVYDFGEEGEIAYLAMELASGGTFDRKARTFHTLDDAIAALTPVGEALQYAHDRGIVHRDIKPINVLIDEQGRPILADFGLARVLSESLDIEVVDEIAGTPQYMAPEQARRADVDFRADIYSFGIVTFEVLTGRVPYDGPTVKVVLDQHVFSPPPSLRAVWPFAPLALDAAIQRATAKLPADRFARVVDFIEALQRAAGESPSLPLRGHSASMPALPRQQASTGQPSAPTVPRSAIAPDTGDSVCPVCGTARRPEDQFCRVCGTPRAASGERLAAVTARVVADVTGATGPSLVPLPEAASRPRLRRRMQRPTGLVGFRRALLVVAALLIAAIGGVIGWQYLEGRAAAASAPGGALWVYIWDERPWFRGGLTGIALVLAGSAALMMRRAVLVENGLSITAYQRLRQYHRVMGYTVLLCAWSVGVFTCLVNRGFQFGTPMAALHSITGAAVLLIIPLKIVVVRFVPALRRYLPYLGWTIFTLLFLVFISSTGKRVWDHFVNDGAAAYNAIQHTRML